MGDFNNLNFNEDDNLNCTEILGLLELMQDDIYSNMKSKLNFETVLMDTENSNCPMSEENASKVKIKLEECLSRCYLNKKKEPEYNLCYEKTNGELLTNLVQKVELEGISDKAYRKLMENYWTTKVETVSNIKKIFEEIPNINSARVQIKKMRQEYSNHKKKQKDVCVKFRNYEYRPKSIEPRADTLEECKSLMFQKRKMVNYFSTGYVYPYYDIFKKVELVIQSLGIEKQFKVLPRVRGEYSIKQLEMIASNKSKKLGITDDKTLCINTRKRYSNTLVCENSYIEYVSPQKTEQKKQKVKIKKKSLFTSINSASDKKQEYLLLPTEFISTVKLDQSLNKDVDVPSFKLITGKKLEKIKDYALKRLERFKDSSKEPLETNDKQYVDSHLVFELQERKRLTTAIDKKNRKRESYPNDEM